MKLTFARVLTLGIFIFGSLTIVGASPVPQPARKAASEWAEFEQVLFPTSAEMAPYQTDILVVSKNNQIIYERYWNGFTPEKAHIAWSISKSISSLIIGTVVQRNELKMDDSICKIAPRFRDKANCTMTFSNVLDSASGLSFLEEYEASDDRTKSSVGQMLYGDGHQDSVAFVLSHKQIYPPGTHYNYSTGDSSLLLGLLKDHYPTEEYNSLPERYLFAPLGITGTTFEQDARGQFIGGASAYLTARSMIRLGQFVLNDGVEGGRRLLPVGWIKHLMEPNPTYTVAKNDAWIPSRQWWLPNAPVMGLDNDPTFPKDIYVARGHWGQYLVIIPSMKLVAIRYGLDQTGEINFVEFLKRLVKAARAS